jgi:dynein heavy chain
MRKEKMFKPWNERVDKFEYDRTLPFFELIVPTDVTYKHRYCMEQLLSVKKSFFFTGDTGVGKSVVINNTLKILSEREGAKVMPIIINFSAKTSADRT